MLQVKLLGQFEVRLNNQPVELASRPAQSLLAYLVLTAGTAHRREKLAGLLWPSTAESNARRNLRQALWRIRQAISSGAQQCLLADDISVAFDANSEYWLDVRVLEKKAAEECSPDDLIRAVSVYGGDLLPGFYDEWVLLERQRLQMVFEHKMKLLLDCLVEAERWEDVLDWGERWIALGQTPEPAYRALMAAHSALGDTSKVAASYQRCAETMRNQLGVEPSQQTRALFEHLSKDKTAPLAARTLARTSTRPTLTAGEGLPAHVHPGHAAALPLPSFLSLAPASPDSPAPFVAREPELGRLDENLSRALAGQGQVVFITGEAGSGKTALAQEFARRALDAYADLTVANGNCSDHTGMSEPYLPFREVLGLLTGGFETRWTGAAITRENARRMWTLMPATVTALVDLAPDLIGSFVPGAALLTRAANLAPDGVSWLDRLEELVARQVGYGGSIPLEQSHVFEQYTNVLLALAAQQPLLVILDDLHWADASSISLLFHLGRRIAQSRVLIVGTYRPEDVAQGWEGGQHPLQSVLSEFKRYLGDIWVDLDRATTVEGRRFVDALLDTEPNRLSEAFRQALFRHTEGHALFTTELLRDMQERGDLQLDQEGRWIEARTLDWEVLPARVEGVIEKRIGRLPAELRLALLVASVEGEEFTAEVVARVQALNERELIRRLSRELDRQHHLVIAQDLHWLGPQRLSHYRFRHSQFQKYLYHSLDRVERAHLHGAVGDALETLYGEQTEQIAVRLARHFQAAGNADKAVDYLLRAGGTGSPVIG